MISLEKAIKTYKVIPEEAPRNQSDRFLNAQRSTCFNWTGEDSTGRSVCANSFMQKTAGCSLSSDRVDVENDLRPRYYNYVNLDVMGLQSANSLDRQQSQQYYTQQVHQKMQNQNQQMMSGNFGLDMKANLKYNHGDYSSMDMAGFDI